MAFMETLMTTVTMRARGRFFVTGFGKTDTFCANCGLEGERLKRCGCRNGTRYCCRACQVEHRPVHRLECFADE
jgi:hypothetical protein